MSDMDEAMEAEFDTVAEWTAQVAIDLGPEYFIPAGCRGSGQPAALDWLLARLQPRAGDLMIDVGAGVGGPDAYAAERTGTPGLRPVLVEPEPGACRAAFRLFHALVVQADARALPFPDACADVLWSLGVLCTTDGPRSQLAMLREMRRVARPGGRIGLLVYLATGPELDDPPEGNHFPTRGGLSALLGEAGLRLVDRAEAEELPEASGEWQQRTEAVERELRRRFGDTPQLREASEQSDRIGHLLRAGQLSCELMVLEAPGLEAPGLEAPGLEA